MVTVQTPDQLAEEGQAYFRNKDFGSAEQAFLRAEEGYQALGNSILAAEMANNRSVALLQYGKAQEALNAVGETVALFDQQDDFRRKALALGNQAAALEALGRLDEAITVYEQSSWLLKTCEEFELRMYVMKSLSKLYLRKNRPLEAWAVYQAGVEGNPSKTMKNRVLRTLLRFPMQFLKSG